MLPAGTPRDTSQSHRKAFFNGSSYYVVQSVTLLLNNLVQYIANS